MTQSLEFEMVFRGNTGPLKAATTEAKQEISSVSNEAAQSAGKIDQHAAALEREAAAARKAAEANEALAAEARRAREEAARAAGANPGATLPASAPALPRPTTPAPTTPGPGHNPPPPRPVPPAPPRNPPVNDNERNDRFRLQNLSYQTFDIGQGLMGGMPLPMIAAQQLPQIIQLYAGQGGMNAAMKDFQTLAAGAARAITPLTLGIGGLTAVLGTGAIAYSNYLASTKEVETAAAGLGRATAGTAAAMEASARAGAPAAGISVSAARSMEAQFLRTGRIGSENFEDLIGLSKDFAATIGIDADVAGDALAKMFADPAQAAETLYRQYGLIDGATARQAINLARQNRESEAQALLLDALPDRLVKAEQATTALGRAWDWAGRMASNAGNAIGGAVDKAVSGPSLEERYETARREYERFSGQSWFLRTFNGAGDRSDAARADVDTLGEELRRRSQLEFEQRRRAEEIARSVRVNQIADASGANSGTLQEEKLRNEIEALRSGQGNGSVDQTRRDTALEAKTRVLDALINRQQRSAELDRLDIQIANERNPILRAELEARRTRLELANQEISAATIQAEAERARNRVIEEAISSAATQAQDMQAELEIRSGLNAQVAAGTLSAGEANRILQEEMTLRPLIAAAASAEGDAKERLNKVIDELRSGYAGLAEQQRNASAQDYLRTQAERIEQLRVEQALIGANDEVRARAMARLEAEQEIRRRGLDSNGDLARQIREVADAEATLNRQVERQAEAWDKVQSSAESTIDGIVDALSSGDLDDALESISKDIKGSLLELGVQNPLKNALLGTDYGTVSDIGGIGGIFSRLFGRTQSDPTSIVSKAMGQSVGAMTVTAGTVMINGGVTGGVGSPFDLVMGGANDNAAAQVAGGGVQSQIWNYFAAKGLKPHQIAGILGNVSAESAFNPTAVGDGGSALGLFQHNDRAPALLNFLGGRGNLGNVTGQLDFAWNELQTTERGALQRLLASTDVRSATAAFAGFERPQGWSLENPEASHNFVGRLRGAEDALTRLGGTTNVAAQGLGTLGTGFDQFGRNLTSLFSAAPSAPSGGGGMFGWLGRLFGGGGIGSFLSSSPQFASAWAGGGIGLYANGGIADRPSIFGEAGIEAAVPLPDGRTIPVTLNVRQAYPHQTSVPAPAAPGLNAPIINNYGSSDVGYQETTDQSGNRQPVITIGEMAAAAIKQRGNPLRRTMMSEFNAKPRKVSR